MTPVRPHTHPPTHTLQLALTAAAGRAQGALATASRKEGGVHFPPLPPQRIWAALHLQETPKQEAAISSALRLRAPQTALGAVLLIGLPLADGGPRSRRTPPAFTPGSRGRGRPFLQGPKSTLL